MTQIHDQLRLGDYYRSKEALGADLNRMIEGSKNYIPTSLETTDALNQLSAYVSELFFQKDVNTTNTES